MKKALLVMSVLGFVALQACNEEKKQNTNESSTTTVDTTTSVPNNTGIQENSQQPMTGQEVQIPNTQPAAVPASAQTATGMNPCLLYTSDAADERSSVDLGGRRIIKKKKNTTPDSLATNNNIHT